MKSGEVKIGECYETKFGTWWSTVRIDSTSTKGGWNATVTRSGRRVHIKDAGRLRRLPSATEDAGESAPPEADRPTDGMGECAFGETAGVLYNGAPRTSATEAAAKVLEESGMVMRATELIEAMAEKGLWSSPAGKTPAATLSAAIMREIAAKGDAARFRRVGRGQFAAVAKEGA